MNSLLLVLLTSLVRLSLAYVPASPTNDTTNTSSGGPNITDVSMVQVQWFPNGSHQQTVSYKLVGNESQGVTKGALVHFSESYVNKDTNPTTTPWIALVSCDYNATNASDVVDIFTLARDKGAVAAILYSLYSSACVIDPVYAETFSQIFDIFSTQSLTSSRLMEYQFSQIGSTNESLTPLYSNYNPSRLNESSSVVTSSINHSYAIAPGYLLSTLTAYNATTVGNGTGDPGDDHRNGCSNAMIGLYTITGCVLALLCIVLG